MNWESKFSSVIRNRGYDYYLAGNVELVMRCEGGFKAFVCGTEQYCVQIFLDGEFISDMSCTCPYADDGNNCKHMAAVLFEIEDMDVRVETENPRLMSVTGTVAHSD